LVTCADDILEALGWEVQLEQKTLFDLNLSEDEQMIFDALEIEDKCVDELQAYTRMSIENLLMYLTTMELKGIIKQVDGDRYRKI
jgi:predicted Rossmann fold nucleotide-binding protein DprA/Smf involved in DNA uptake